MASQAMVVARARTEPVPTEVQALRWTLQPRHSHIGKPEDSSCPSLLKEEMPLRESGQRLGALGVVIVASSGSSGSIADCAQRCHDVVAFWRRVFIRGNDHATVTVVDCDDGSAIKAALGRFQHVLLVLNCCGMPHRGNAGTAVLGT